MVNIGVSMASFGISQEGERSLRHYLPLNDSSGILDGLHAYFKLVNIIKRVKNAKDIDPISLRLLAEVVYCVVRQPANVSQ